MFSTSSFFNKIAQTYFTGGNYSAPPMASEMRQGLTETITAEMVTPPAETIRVRDIESDLGFCGCVSPSLKSISVLVVRC